MSAANSSDELVLGPALPCTFGRRGLLGLPEDIFGITPKEILPHHIDSVFMSLVVPVRWSSIHRRFCGCALKRGYDK